MAEVPEQNWLRHTPGVPLRLHFSDHSEQPRVITDPWFKTPRTVQSLVFRVDRLDGATVDKLYSVVSDRLRGELQPYLEGRKYLGYEFVMIKDGPGSVPPRILQVIPR